MVDLFDGWCIPFGQYGFLCQCMQLTKYVAVCLDFLQDLSVKFEHLE